VAQQGQDRGMDIALHLGVHCTDDERLIRALMKNRDRLAAEGIALPPSRSYRQMLPKLVRSLRGGAAGADAQEMLRDALWGEETPERVIFSHENLACFPAQAVGENGLYPYLHLRLAALANIFPADHCTFFVALRNPATLVPDLLERSNVTEYAGLMGNTDPRALRWGPVLMQMLEAVPDAGLIFWCNEDTPLLWPEILARVAGVTGPEALEGADDMLALLLTDTGFARYREFITSHDGPLTSGQRRKLAATFLRKFAKPEEMEVAVDLPGWTDEMVAEMTEAYDADVAEVAALPGVTFLLP
jgi:hypothetical protein